MSIIAGDIYEHKDAPERRLIVLDVEQTLIDAYGNDMHNFIKVEYISTTNEENIGIIAYISTFFIETKYVGVNTIHDWEV